MKVAQLLMDDTSGSSQAGSLFLPHREYRPGVTRLKELSTQDPVQREEDTNGVEKNIEAGYAEVVYAEPTSKSRNRLSSSVFLCPSSDGEIRLLVSF